MLRTLPVLTAGVAYCGLVELRAVVFDLDDTLVVEEATVRESLEGAAAEVLEGVDPRGAADVVLDRARQDWRAGPHHDVCVTLGFASWEGLWSSFEGCHPTLDDLRSWVPAFRDDVWGRSLLDLGVSSEVVTGRLADSFVERQRRGHQPIAGTADLVTELARHLRLGLLTNGPSDIQRVKLEGSGLQSHFTSVVVSGEVGAGKPDPAVFSLVLDDLGVAPQEAAMVGDSWERDVVGALGAGMTAVWISHGRPTPQPELDVLVVQTPGEVGEALRRTA